MVLFNNTADVDESFNNKLDYFLPLNLDNGIKLLATWSFTHRAAGRFGEGHIGHVSDAIEYYKDWLDGSKQAVISGDFNNSVIWDKGNKDSNFRNTNTALESMGFKSSYHKLNNEDFGQEECATLFHTKKRDKTYHIDYVFLIVTIKNPVTSLLFIDRYLTTTNAFKIPTILIFNKKI